jgi:pantetheine-phosphate adenylyltransferase
MRCNIGLFPGSFNPFHVGHMNILLKAEKIFDTVIIARGINLEKQNEFVPLPIEIQDRKILTYDGLLTDFIDSLEYEVTVIRGLRNQKDFQSELEMYFTLQDLKPDIKLMTIFCDRQYQHISSSNIRLLQKYGKPIPKSYLNLKLC